MIKMVNFRLSIFYHNKKKKCTVVDAMEQDQDAHIPGAALG